MRTFSDGSYIKQTPPWFVEVENASLRSRARSMYLQPGGAQAMRCGDEASSCHISTSAAILSLLSAIHRQMLTVLFAAFVHAADDGTARSSNS